MAAAICRRRGEITEGKEMGDGRRARMNAGASGVQGSALVRADQTFRELFRTGAPATDARALNFHRHFDQRLICARNAASGRSQERRPDRQAVPFERHAGALDFDSSGTAQNFQKHLDALPRGQHAEHTSPHAFKGALRHDHFRARLKFIANEHDFFIGEVFAQSRRRRPRARAGCRSPKWTREPTPLA